MSSTDYRREMTRVDFERLSISAEYPIVSYYEALVAENDRIDAEVYLQPKNLEVLSAGQKMLIQLAEFDGQVKNGGITQFFWNFTEYISDTAAWISKLGATQLLGNYQRAMDTLSQHHKAWSKFRAADDARAGESLLNLEWFDDLYYDKWGDDEQGEWGLRSRGLQFDFAQRVVKFIQTHSDQFIFAPHNPPGPARWGALRYSERTRTAAPAKGRTLTRPGRP